MKPEFTHTEIAVPIISAADDSPQLVSLSMALSALYDRMRGDLHKPLFATAGMGLPPVQQQYE